MTITYIFNSCYLLEFSNFSILIDFYEDAEKENGELWINDYLLSKKEDLYVLCTHSHADHYNPVVHDWKSEKGNIKYIFSKEMMDAGVVADPGGIVFLDKLEVFEDNHIKVKTFGSTDIGGSFLITVDKKQIFHSGDLNNWHWNEEVPKMEATGYENNYLCELELMTEFVEHLYLAMFPIDPRLGKDFMKGAEQFVRRIPTDYLLSMHFGENYDKVNQFEDFAKQHDCNYLKINKKGETYKL